MSHATCLAEMQANPDDPRHGSATGYTYGCRCEACAEARRAYEVQKKARVLQALLADPDDSRHGSTYGYQCGCRCTACTEANRRKSREQWPRIAASQRNKRLQRTYPDLGGADGWEQKWDEQGGLCAACGERMTRPRGVRLRMSDAVVDHEWRTGLANALLCSLCNLTAGKYNNDAARVLGLAQYIDTYHSADFFPERTDPDAE